MLEGLVAVKRVLAAEIVYAAGDVEAFLDVFHHFPHVRHAPVLVCRRLDGLPVLVGLAQVHEDVRVEAERAVGTVVHPRQAQSDGVGANLPHFPLGHELVAAVMVDGCEWRVFRQRPFERRAVVDLVGAHEN